MKLKKLVKKILKEQKEKGTNKKPYTGPRKEGTVHLYSGCMLSNSTAGFDYSGPNVTAPWGYGNNFSTGIITQNTGPSFASLNTAGLGYNLQDYVGYFEPTDIEDLNSMALAANLTNNNNVIHNMWGLTSPGQVVKFHTTPVQINNTNIETGFINRGVCMKYEGSTVVGFNTLVGNGETGTDFSLGGYTIHDYASVYALDVVTGTFSSCEECEQFANGGLPTPEEDNYGMGQGIPPLDGKPGGSPIQDTDNLTNDDSDKDPQVSRMQDLANIKPKNLKKL